MDSSISEVQFPEPGEGSHINQPHCANESSSYGLSLDSGDDDTPADKIQYISKNCSSIGSEEGMDSSDAAYGSYESTSGCLPPSSNITSTPLNSSKLPKSEGQTHGMDSIVLEDSQDDLMDIDENIERPEASSEVKPSVEAFTTEASLTTESLHQGEGSRVSESVEAATSDETTVKPEMDNRLGLQKEELEETTVKPEMDNRLGLKKEDLEDNNGDVENKLDLGVLPTEIATNASSPKIADVSKIEVLSEDEEVSFPKSGAESSSSKEESLTAPSCSGTSHRGMNSHSSESEDDLPDIDIALPLKKRKREFAVETISSGSSSCIEDEDEPHIGHCNEDEDDSNIDYANLTPEQIRALIEQAKNIKHKCHCPKKTLAELPVKGPMKPSGRCNVGKGDWREKVPCPDCASGFCREGHKSGRKGRRRYTHTRRTLAKTRARGTIGQDVPIIDLSDSEDVDPVCSKVASEVTIATASTGECIVLSSSDDDSDIVIEGVIKPDPKPQEPPCLFGESFNMSGSPEVVVLPAVDGPGEPSATPAAALAVAPATAPATAPTMVPGLIPSMAPQMSPAVTPAMNSAMAPAVAAPNPRFPFPPLPLATDLDSLWPDIDHEIWNDMFFEHSIMGAPNLGVMAPNTSQASVNPPVPERPPSPEGWCCPICLESKTAVVEIMSTTCGHIFCGTCIRSAVRLHKKCPTCRKKLTVKQFHKIFL